MDIMRFPCYNNMEKEAILWEKYLQIAFKDFEQNLDIRKKILQNCAVWTPSCISRWETGKWSPSTANSVRLAKALKVSVEDLYDDGEASIEDVATKQAVAEFQELKPQERGLGLTLIRELKKLREKD